MESLPVDVLIASVVDKANRCGTVETRKMTRNKVYGLSLLVAIEWMG